MSETQTPTPLSLIEIGNQMISELTIDEQKIFNQFKLLLSEREKLANNNNNNNNDKEQANNNSNNNDKENSSPRIRSDIVLIRYLIFTRFDIEEAIKLVPVMDEIIDELNSKATDEDVVSEMKTNKWVVGGRDKLGRRILIYDFHLHIPTDFSIYCSMKSIFYALDAGMMDLPTIRSGIVVLCLMGESGWANFDLNAEKVYAEYYSKLGPSAKNILGNSILVDSPWYVWLAMKIVSPFVPAEVFEKLRMLTMPEIESEFGLDQLKPQVDLIDFVKSDSKLTRWK